MTATWTATRCKEFWTLYDKWVKSDSDEDYQAMREHVDSCEKCEKKEG